MAERGKQRSRRVAFGVPALVAVGVFVLVACGSDKPKQAATSDTHDVHNPFSTGVYQRILNATQTDASPQAALEAEGESLFNSRDISKPGQACADCHPGGGSAGTKGIIVHPTKPGDFTGPRTALALWNVGKTAPYGWPGSTPTLQAFSVKVIGNFFKTGATQDPAVTAHQAAALTAYMNTLVPPTTAFDTGLTGDALAGKAIFDAKCATCHTPPLFTDGKVHNLGTPAVKGSADPGNALPAVAPGALTPGGFNTPQLRGISKKGPYMHNGIFATLDDVLKFYNGHSSVPNLQVSGNDRKLLLAFLNSL